MRTDTKQTPGNPGYDSCARLAAVAKAKIDDEKPTVKICDSPNSGGQCTDLEAPAEKCGMSHLLAPSQVVAIFVFTKCEMPQFLFLLNGMTRHLRCVRVLPLAFANSSGKKTYIFPGSWKHLNRD